jgi:hypothetical protein
MSSSPKQFAVDVSRVHIVITGVYAIVACILLSAIVFGFI